MDTKNRAGRGTKNETRRNEKNGTAGRETERARGGGGGEEVVVDRLREIARLVPGAKCVNHEELVREICGSWP